LKYIFIDKLASNNIVILILLYLATY